MEAGLADPLVEAVIEDPRWDAFGLEPLAERAARAALDELGLDPAGFVIALLGCDDARIAELNAGFRGKGAPTNVLSWPSQERGAEVAGGVPALPLPGEEEPEELGDIAIAFDTCRREAAEAGRGIEDHVAHLVVHGVLHLLGYDHVREADGDLMEALEVRILARMGISDPYGQGGE